MELYMNTKSVVIFSEGTEEATGTGGPGALTVYYMLLLHYCRLLCLNRIEQQGHRYLLVVRTTRWLPL